MTEEQVIHIEQTLGIELPSEYKQIITNYPSLLISTDAQDFGLLNNPHEIIAQNRFVLENGACGGKWPSQYFIIGINGAGDYYVIKHAENKFSVGFANHETASIELYARNLDEFIAKLFAEI